MLPNISGSKGNKTINSGQLIECNTKNIFLKKSYTKCSGETSPKPFSKNSKLSISLDQQSEIFVVVCLLFFLLYVQVKDYQHILKLRCGPFTFTWHKSLLKTKRGLKIVSLQHFLHDFWIKIFLTLYSIMWPYFIFWLPLLLEILSNIYIVIIYFQFMKS